MSNSPNDPKASEAQLTSSELKLPVAETSAPASLNDAFNQTIAILHRAKTAAERVTSEEMRARILTGVREIQINIVEKLIAAVPDFEAFLKLASEKELLRVTPESLHTNILDLNPPIRSTAMNSLKNEDLIFAGDYVYLNPTSNELEVLGVYHLNGCGPVTQRAMAEVVKKVLPVGRQLTPEERSGFERYKLQRPTHKYLVRDFRLSLKGR